jgi:hypothetical protein
MGEMLGCLFARSFGALSRRGPSDYACGGAGGVVWERREAGAGEMWKDCGVATWKAFRRMQKGARWKRAVPTESEEGGCGECRDSHFKSR